MAKKSSENSKRFDIYVIGLDKEVLKKKKFKAANPAYIPGKPCVYVGMTSRTPKERFDQHKRGYKSNRYSKKFGLYLQKKHFEKHNPMTYEDAVEMEVKVAQQLRAKGYAVWQN